MCEMISYFYLRIQIHMSIITIDETYTFTLDFIYDHMREIKSLNYVQLIQYIDEHYERECYDHKLYPKCIGHVQDRRIFAEYIVDDLINRCNADRYNYKTDLWYSLCRMLFIESHKFNDLLKQNKLQHTVSITDVAFGKIRYDKFVIDGITHSSTHCEDDYKSILICKGYSVTNITIECDDDIHTSNESNDKSNDDSNDDHDLEHDSDDERDYNSDIPIDEPNKPIKPDLIAAYHKLTPIEKYIVDHISQFKCGVALDDITIQPKNIEVFNTVRKCCDKSKILYSDYRKHLEEHQIEFGDLYTHKPVPSNSKHYFIYIFKLHSNDDPYAKYLSDIAESRKNA